MIIDKNTGNILNSSEINKIIESWKKSQVSESTSPFRFKKNRKGKELDCKEKSYGMY